MKGKNMNVWKKIIAVGLVSVLSFSFFGCGTDKKNESSATSESSEVAVDKKNENNSDESSEGSDNSSNIVDESSVVYGEYEVEYDKKELNESCANVIKDYFTAIEYQDYDAYKATLFPFYFEIYNNYLKDNYNYGMETSMEQLHQMLLDQAGTENIVISGISVKLAEVTEEDSEDTDLAETYLAQYSALLGESFTKEAKANADNIVVVSFTMTGTCDGEEKTIMENMELLMAEKDGVYTILG